MAHPSPITQDGGGGECKLWIWIWVLDVVGRAYSRKKGYACEFSEKGQKKGKIFENLAKNVQNVKIF